MTDAFAEAAPVPTSTGTIDAGQVRWAGSGQPQLRNRSGGLGACGSRSHGGSNSVDTYILTGASLDTGEVVAQSSLIGVCP